MRIAPLAAVVLAFAVAHSVGRPATAADDDADVVVRNWLVLAPVDVAARRTLRPDAVFAKYLLDRRSAPPKDGDEVTGTLGTSAKWAAAEANAEGQVAATGWSYASVESATDRVVLAKLEGAGLIFVNGAGFPGDVYGLGDAGFPVALRKGANDVFVAGPRGGFKLTLVKPVPSFRADGPMAHRTENLVIDRNRTVEPDAVEGAESSSLRSIRVMNASAHASNDGSIVRLGVVTMAARGLPEGAAGDARKPVKPGEAYRRTFVSNIDGSVQSYALVPPSPAASADRPVGLVLSLHGAGVDCMDQARAYAPKPDFWIVCPTNRGRYGFDWQDWGRLDAYEVLEDALKVTGVDPRRVYLTGHSMGGHGTWHLAANDPGRFLAIAPSAGWSGFDSYGNAGAPITPLGWMWRAADGASRTLDLVGNLAQIPTYVLHGEKDDNVPASEARMMIDAVTKAGGKVASHFEPDAGHWWDKDEKTPGADCVDWPGIWELFRKTEPMDDRLGAKSVSFMTTNPSDLADLAWVEIQQAIDSGRPCRVTATRVDPVTADGPMIVAVSTENVRRLDVSSSSARPTEHVIDGQQFGAATRFVRVDGRWRPQDVGERGWWLRERCAGRSGPFKQAFTNRFLLVYGTAGDDAEDAELLEKARCDSEVWAYRANGDANLMSDAQFLAGDFADRNVIVYGNADTNAAWKAVFDDDCPIQAKRGAMTVNGTKHEGVVAAAFVRPRKGSDRALAAAFADTGAAATRMFYAFPVFGSGIGIPDYVVFGPGFLGEMDGDVRAAGWFDYAWR